MFRTLRQLCGILFLLLLAGCSSRIEPPGPQQPLVVGLSVDPVFQQPVPVSEGMDGFSRDLAAMFAKSLGVELRFVTAPNYPALLRMLAEGRIHLAATIPAIANDTSVRYTTQLLVSRQLIVQHADALPADSPDKLAGREISVLHGAPQIQALRALKIDPLPQLIVRSDGDELELLAGVARRRHELAASDELHYAIAANFYPDLQVAMELPEQNAYAWAVAPDSQQLLDRANEFIEQARQNGTLHRLYDRYFGHIHRLDASDITAFLDKARRLLPDYRQAFQEAQEITGIDWRLLAALAYQESQWDPLATSPTGVRGMMMLTEDTADRLGVTNRLDAVQSIRAGSKYLAMLMDDLPPETKHPDRLWLALAAYNLGMGHLNGARQFAPVLKKDPNSWTDMKEVLPLMSRPEYYRRLKSGRARGGEAVIMVENIRNYYDVLSRLEPIWTPPSMAWEKPATKGQSKSNQRNGARTSTPPR